MRALMGVKAFTLMELIVAIVIIGTMASMAIPKYAKSVEQSYERTAASNLNLIRSAIKIYKLNNGSYPPSDLSDTAAVNSTFGLMILSDQNMGYTCNSSSAQYFCFANSSYGWSLHTGSMAWEDDPAHCAVANTCPTCTIGGWECPWDQ